MPSQHFHPESFNITEVLNYPALNPQNPVSFLPSRCLTFYNYVMISSTLIYIYAF